ncbi:MAG: hypothetical protein JXA69_05845, partial [Phycisphaerae bacterium]|nr:hypothetical protein [Phycisphaerae bacterium]
MNERMGVSSGNGRRRHGGSRRRAAAMMLSGLASLAVACQPTGSDWIGLNLQLGHTDYAGHWESAKPTATDREIYFGLAAEVGVGHVRDLFMSWYRAEPRQGQPYDFTFSDAMAQQAGQANLDLLGLCWMVPAWAAEGASPAGWSFGVPRRDQVDAFVRFVTAFVERYDMDGWHDAPRLKRPIRYYEFMHKMEDVPVADYAFWLQHFYRAVKAADPKAHIVLGGLSSPGFRMIQRPDGDYPTYFDRL